MTVGSERSQQNSKGVKIWHINNDRHVCLDHVEEYGKVEDMTLVLIGEYW